MPLKSADGYTVETIKLMVSDVKVTPEQARVLVGYAAAEVCDGS